MVSRKVLNPTLIPHTDNKTAAKAGRELHFVSSLKDFSNKTGPRVPKDLNTVSSTFYVLFPNDCFVTFLDTK